MEAANLIEKHRSPFLKWIYVGIVFLAVLSGIFYLYGYLWQTVGRPVVRSFARDYYTENKHVSCASDSDCIGRCSIGALGEGEACLCLRSECYFIGSVEHFSQNKFCETDGDCIVSCYEGPVARRYYDSISGFERDCAEGCKISDKTKPGENNISVCVNNQCRFENNRTCFISTIPQAS